MGGEGTGAGRAEQGLVSGGIWGCEERGGREGKSGLPGLEDCEDGGTLSWEKGGGAGSGACDEFPFGHCGCEVPVGGMIRGPLDTWALCLVQAGTGCLKPREWWYRPRRVCRAGQEGGAGPGREGSQLRRRGAAGGGGEKPEQLVSWKPGKEDVSRRRARANVSGRTEPSRRLPHVEGIVELGGSRGRWI